MLRDALKVGELAKRTGLTVRTLHHYDEIGLLQPTLHTDSGHRLYTAADVARLQQIISLRQLGFSLEEIRGCLLRREHSPVEILQKHIARLRQQIEMQQHLCGRLEGLAALLGRTEEVSVETLLQTIEAMKMVENLYTPEQLKQFEEVGKLVGPDEIRAVEEGWTALLPEIRANLHLDPASAEAQELGRRWDELTERTMRGYQQFPDLKKAIGDNYKQGKFEGNALTPQAAEFAFMEKIKAARKA